MFLLDISAIIIAGFKVRSQRAGVIYNNEDKNELVCRGRMITSKKNYLIFGF
jgi:hypothetical protein